MATDGPSRWRLAGRVLLLALLLVPVAVQWLGVGDGIVPAFDAGSVVRLLGLGAILLVLGLLVVQKRRTRGQQPSADAPEEDEDRQVEGTGEVYAPYAYNSQLEAKRESERIERRADRIADSDRGRDKRR